MAVHQAPPSLGFSRQEHWSGLPFPSPMHESEKWKWSHLVVSDSWRPHGLQPTRLLCPWNFWGKSTGVGAIILALALILFLYLILLPFMNFLISPIIVKTESYYSWWNIDWIYQFWGIGSSLLDNSIISLSRKIQMSEHFMKIFCGFGGFLLNMLVLCLNHILLIRAHVISKGILVVI